MNKRMTKYGAISGLGSGLVFGVMLAAMGMLPRIGQLIGVPTVVGGLLLHLVISAFFGAAYSLAAGRLLSRWRSGLFGGVIYGAGLWLLGPLTLMPLLMGLALDTNWNLIAVTAQLPSLLGHLLYGGLLGVGRVWLLGRQRTVVTLPSVQRTEKYPANDAIAVSARDTVSRHAS